MDWVAMTGGAAAELALFAAIGFLLFGFDDLLVDLLYAGRRLWRQWTIYRHIPRGAVGRLPAPRRPGLIAIFVPAWDEGPVVAAMLRSALARLQHDDYRIFVGHYRNDPVTAAALRDIRDPRVTRVLVPVRGPTTKADCLNHLYDSLRRAEELEGRRAKAVVLHDSEDVVHPLELRLFDSLIERASIVQLPVVPLLDRSSRWIAGHYADEFAEAHGKELVVREAVGAAIPLARVGCAIARSTLDRMAAANGGRPFADESLTEDYEFGLRLGAMGERAMFVRLPAVAGRRGLVSSRGHFPTDLDSAVRQKARWIRGIAFSGWDRLGWSGGIGERWMRMRDRRGPIAAFLLAAAYLAALLWALLLLLDLLGVASPPPPLSPLLVTLLTINAGLLLWRLAVRAAFVWRAYGWVEALRSVPRAVVGNIIAMLAVRRALFAHARGTAGWDKTRHVFPADPERA